MLILTEDGLFTVSPNRPESPDRVDDTLTLLLAGLLLVRANDVWDKSGNSPRMLMAVEDGLLAVSANRSESPLISADAATLLLAGLLLVSVNVCDKSDNPPLMLMAVADGLLMASPNRPESSDSAANALMSLLAGLLPESASCVEDKPGRVVVRSISVGSGFVRNHRTRSPSASASTSSRMPSGSWFVPRMSLAFEDRRASMSSKSKLTTSSCEVCTWIWNPPCAPDEPKITSMLPGPLSEIRSCELPVT